MRYAYSSDDVYDHVYLNDQLFTWFCVNGAEAGLGDTDRCVHWKLREETYLFSWLEKNLGVEGMVLVDLKALRTVGIQFGLDQQSGDLVNITMGAYAMPLGHAPGVDSALPGPGRQLTDEGPAAVDLELSDRVAVVTGGASGIGRACVERLAAEGAEVVILDRSPAGRDAAAALARHGHDVTFVQCDISTEPDDARRVRGRHRQARRDRHALVLRREVSGPVGATAPDINVEDWDRVMAVNVRGSFLAAKHALPALTRSPVGAVMFVASDAALVAFEGMSPYCTSKGAVVMLAKSLSVDFPTVRFNCLCPGIVDTPMSRADLGFPDGFAETDLPVISCRPTRQTSRVPGVAERATRSTERPWFSDFGYVARSALPALQFTE